MARRLGRPPKYKARYCQELVDHMRLGYSYEAFAGRIGTCAKTLYNWESAHPEFLQAKAVGFEASRLFWEGLNLRAASGNAPKSTNGAVLIFNMKNRFNYRDRSREESRDEAVAAAAAQGHDVQRAIDAVEKVRAIADDVAKFHRRG